MTILDPTVDDTLYEAHRRAILPNGNVSPEGISHFRDEIAQFERSGHQCGEYWHFLQLAELLANHSHVPAQGTSPGSSAT